MVREVGKLYTLDGPDRLDEPETEIVNVFVAGVGAFERGTPVILTRIGNSTTGPFKELEEGKYYVLVDGKEGWVFGHELKSTEEEHDVQGGRQGVGAQHGARADVQGHSTRARKASRLLHLRRGPTLARP